MGGRLSVKVALMLPVYVGSVRFVRLVARGGNGFDVSPPASAGSRLRRRQRPRRVDRTGLNCWSRLDLLIRSSRIRPRAAV
jgi:hypothetical protein